MVTSQPMWRRWSPAGRSTRHGREVRGVRSLQRLAYLLLALAALDGIALLLRITR